MTKLIGCWGNETKLIDETETMIVGNEKADLGGNETKLIVRVTRQRQS